MDMDKFHACLDLLEAIRTCLYGLRYYIPSDVDLREQIYTELDMIREFVGGN